MNELRALKESIKKFVGKNDAFVIPLLKFAATFIALLFINSKVGYMKRLSSLPITLIIALAGSFLPINLTIVILALVITAHVYSLGFESALFVLAVFVILFLLYFRFSSKDSVAVILTPILTSLGIPEVMPVSMGLTGTLSSMVSVASGTIVYYLIDFISDNAEALGSGEMSFKELVNGVVGNRGMIVMAAVFAATVMIVYVIRRLSVDHSWLIAIVGGNILCFMMLLIGNTALNAGLSMGLAFFGMVISIILNIILQFFCFDLNYNRTEKVQFEDDEYYYYVKAVPKNVITSSSEVKKPQAKQPVRQPAARPAAKPVQRDSNAARAEVRQKAATAARNTTAKPVDKNKGPFGLSGGRPAGEGRRNGPNN